MSYRHKKRKYFRAGALTAKNSHRVRGAATSFTGLPRPIMQIYKIVSKWPNIRLLKILRFFFVGSWVVITPH